MNYPHSYFHTLILFSRQFIRRKQERQAKKAQKNSEKSAQLVKKVAQSTTHHSQLITENNNEVQQAQSFIQVTPHFNLRQTRIKKPTLLYCVFSYGGKQWKVPTGVKVYPSQWNVSRQIAVVSNLQNKTDNRNNTIANNVLADIRTMFSKCVNFAEDADELTDFLGIITNKIYPKCCRLPVTKRDNFRYIGKKKTSTKTIEDTMKIMTEKSEPLMLYLARVSEEYTTSRGTTGENHRRTLSKMKTYIAAVGEEENNKACLGVKQYKRFRKWLEEESGMQVKSIQEIEKGYKALCKLVNEREEREGADRIATEMMTLSEDRRKKEDKQGKSTPLTEHELMRLVQLDGLTERQTEARDIFLLECLTGQRVSDIPKVLKSFGRTTEVKGVKMVAYRNEKTGEEAVVPLLPLAEGIINRYSEGLQHFHIDRAKTKQVINQIGVEINKVVKELGKKSELCRAISYREQVGQRLEMQEKPLFELLHNHTARHTFVTIMMRKGVDKEVVKIVTAHTSDKMIDEVYNHVTTEDKMAKLANGLIANREVTNSAIYGIPSPQSTPQQTITNTTPIDLSIQSNVMLDRIQQLTIRGAEMEREKKQIENKLRHIEDNPMEWCSEQVDSMRVVVHDVFPEPTEEERERWAEIEREYQQNIKKM